MAQHRKANHRRFAVNGALRESPRPRHGPRLHAKPARCTCARVRIAISGAHCVGKSTLLEELSAALPKYSTVEEPYHVLTEDGYEFADPPTLEDFEAQLEHSLEALNESEDNTLFDRSPADFIAYLSAHEDTDSFDLDAWLPRVREAAELLDVIVFVPIEARDRIAAANSDDYAALRRSVDEGLREMLVDGALGLDVEVIEVAGSVAERVRTVLERVRTAR